MKFFPAPWSRTLVVISTLATLLCLAITFLPHTPATPANPPFFLLRAVPLGLLAVSALFTIRGYTITDGVILIHRLLWSTRLPLRHLQSARVEPNAMQGSLRTFGNGGLYSFTGFYRNRALGGYRAWVTDPARTVVFRYPGRTVVLSPAEPERFVEELPGGDGATSGM